MSLPKRIARRILRTAFVGRAISAALRACGLESLSRRTSEYSQYLPYLVPLRFDDGAVMRMGSARGTDYVARLVWQKGWQAYEPPLARLYARVAGTGEVIIGVGANSGFYELVAAAVNPSASLYAFEPFPPAIAALEDNIRINGLDGRVRVVKKAVGDANASVNLYVPEKWFGDTLETSSSLSPDFRPSHAEILTVSCVTLDAFAQEAGLTRLDVLRIDVEGAEHMVLAGAREAVAQFRPIIFIEVLEQGDTEPLTRFCAFHNYVPCWFDADGVLHRSAEVMFRASNTNQVFCPTERLADLGKFAQDAGLSLDLVLHA